MLSMLNFSRRCFRFNSSKENFSCNKFAGVDLRTKNLKFHQFSIPIPKLTIMSVVGGSQSRENDANDEDHKLNFKIIPTTNPKPSPSSSVSALADFYSPLKSSKVEKNNEDVNPENDVQLLLKIVKSGWIVVEKSCSYNFFKKMNVDDDDDDDDDEEEEKDEEDEEDGVWMLKVGKSIRGKVSSGMHMKMFKNQKKVELVNKGLWALLFNNDEELMKFVVEFDDHLHVNAYVLEATEENKLRVVFIGLVKPEESQ